MADLATIDGIVSYFAGVGNIPRENVFVLSALDRQETDESFVNRIAQAIKDTGKDAMIVDDVTPRGYYVRTIPAGSHAEQVQESLDTWHPMPFI
jgi:hypothetical protein